VNLLDLGDGAAILLDVVAWTVLGTLAGYVGHRLPTSWLARDRGPLRLAPVEHGGSWYARRLRIKAWKDRLPEAGGLFRGGTSKRHLVTTDPAGLAAFAAETRRAEWVHWALLAVTPAFVLWNPPALSVVMVTYGVAANLPCLVVQRYNRARVTALLARR